MLSNANSKNTKLGFLFLLLGIFTWATIEITFKLIQSAVSSLMANFLRMLIGALILFIYLAIIKKTSGLKKYLKRNAKYLIPAAIIGLVFGQIVYLYGTGLTQANYAATIFSANPIIIAFLSAYFLKEKLNATKIFGVIIGFIGVFIMITELNFSSFFSKENLLGNLLVFIGMVLWCIDIIAGKAIMNKARQNDEITGVESEYFNFATFFIAAIVMFFVVIFSGDITKISNYSFNTWLGMLYLGIVTGGIGYVLFFKGLDLMPASKGINVFYLKPIIATVIASILLPNEQITIFLIIGLIIEIIALLLVTKE